MISPSKEWLEKMADIEDASESVSVGGMACDVGMTYEIPDVGGIDPCAVERWIHQGQHVPDDDVFVHNGARKEKLCNKKMRR